MNRTEVGLPQAGVDAATTPFRHDVEGMRAIAVILVVAFHAGLSRVSGGFVGVDVFFVLSGFLITGLLLDELYRTGSVSLTRFYARRARRLLPMAALVLTATAGLAQRYLPPLDSANLLGDIRAAAFYFSNWHFAATSTEYMSDADKSPVLHYWSLSVEEQFYIVWPLLLLAVAAIGRRGARRLRRRVGVGLAALGVGSLALSAATSASAGPWGYFGLHTRAWELAAGGLLAMARPRLPQMRPAPAVVLGWIGMAVVIGSALGYDANTVFPGWAALLPVAGTVALVAAGAAARAPGSASALLSLPPVSYVGRISYAWYLWHWPLLVIATHRFGTPAGTDGAPGEGGEGARTLGLLPALATVGLSFALAVICHHALESPVRRAASLVRSAPRSLALGAALTTGAVMVAGVGLSARPLAPSTWAAAAQGRAPATLANRSVGGLTVSPDAARDDRPSGTGPCYVLAYKTSKTGGPCIFGDIRARRTMVLLGDSQAEQWTPALKRYGRQHGWKVYLWAKASCPFNDVSIWLTAYKGDYSACHQWRDNVYTAMRRLPRVDIVVLSRSRSYMGMVIGDHDERLTPDTVKPYWRAATRRTVHRLSDLASHIVLLHSTPVASTDVPACLSEHLTDPGACAFARDTGTQDMLFAAERAASAGLGSAAVLDVTSSICPGDPCPVVTPQGLILYRDMHHLTASFARSLSDALGAATARLAHDSSP